MVDRSGTAAPDVILGTLENDYIDNIGAAADVVDTLAGDDTVRVVAGSAGLLDTVPDIVDMGVGDDLLVIDFSGLSTGFTMSAPVLDNVLGLGGSLTLGLVPSLVYTGVERYEISGSRAADGITGGNQADRLFGNGGNDTINGGDGGDWLNGGAGADTINGGAGIDTVDYTGSSAAVMVALRAGGSGVVSGGDAQGDILSGIESVTGSAFDDTLRGNADQNRLDGGAGRDRLFGGDGEDRLLGGDGNDVLRGEAGRDVLMGGAGADLFVYDKTSDSGVGFARDVILDFNGREGDRIDLSALDANTNVDGNQAFAFIGSNRFSGVAGELRTVSSDSSSRIEVDFDGDKIADFAIGFQGALTIVATDLVL